MISETSGVYQPEQVAKIIVKDAVVSFYKRSHLNTHTPLYDRDAERKQTVIEWQVYIIACILILSFL